MRWRREWALDELLQLAFGEGAQGAQRAERSGHRHDEVVLFIGDSDAVI
jgi:hypothetical protein